MATDRAGIVEAVCIAIAQGDSRAAADAVGKYPFEALNNAGRSYAPVQATRIFVRDGFVDRYSGARLSR
jgi:hypothetical protein